MRFSLHSQCIKFKSPRKYNHPDRKSHLQEEVKSLYRCCAPSQSRLPYAAPTLKGLTKIQRPQPNTASAPRVLGTCCPFWPFRSLGAWWGVIICRILTGFAAQHLFIIFGNFAAIRRSAKTDSRSIFVPEFSFSMLLKYPWFSCTSVFRLVMVFLRKWHAV